MCRSTLIQLLTVLMVSGKPMMSHVQSGYVPIFGNRVTLEPITFTFTTPPPKNNPMKSFPTLRPFSPDFFNALPAPTIQNNVAHQENQNQEFKYEVQMPTQSRPVWGVPTPAYSQAQIYKAMQASLQQDVYSTYRTIWKQMMDTWIKLRTELLSEGVEQDWHVFWQKFTGTVEPYMNSITTQFGRLVNVFLKHQHEQESKTWG